MNNEMTFETIKDLLDQKGGKYVIDAFIDEFSIYYLYENGWEDSDSSAYGMLGGYEYDVSKSIQSKPFNSSDEAYQFAIKTELPEGGSIDVIKKLLQNGDLESYAFTTVKLPTWDELEEYANSRKNPVNINDAWDLLDLIDEYVYGKTKDYEIQ